SSLWDKTGRRALFAATGSGAPPRGGSPLVGHWLAGQLALARELAYFYAPSVNSYKRYQSGSFAPTRIVAGWDNRTCGFRLCGAGVGEHYLHTARLEQQAFDQAVTDWELMRNFERI